MRLVFEKESSGSDKSGIKTKFEGEWILFSGKMYDVAEGSLGRWLDEMTILPLVDHRHYRGSFWTFYAKL